MIARSHERARELQYEPTGVWDESFRQLLIDIVYGAVGRMVGTVIPINWRTIYSVIAWV